MQRANPADWPHARIAPDAVIEGDDISIGEGAEIAAGVCISARRIDIGSGTRIERGTTVRGLGGPMNAFTVGDFSLIGFSNQILTTDFTLGDYGQIHNSGLHSGYQPLTIGHNCWVGQNTILNCTQRLTLGNNVRIGTQSQLWTHVASGELLEGCTLFGESPLVLEDNVWIVGGAVISPGLTLARNSIIMTGSVLTRSTEPFHTYAGVPAKDVTDKLPFWRDVSDDEKTDMIKEFISDFGARYSLYKDNITFLASISGEDLCKYRGSVIITKCFLDWGKAIEERVSVYDLSTKTYSKLKTDVEVAWMRWITGYRARFVPRQF